MHTPVKKGWKLQVGTCTHPDFSFETQISPILSDAEIENILTTKANHTKHVLIFVSSPSTSSSQQHAVADESQTYEMDSPILHEVLHSDLKRDVGVYPRNSSSEDEHQKGLPLFERYSFLSPGKSSPLPFLLIIPDPVNRLETFQGR
jgi:hypothetical protein